MSTIANNTAGFDSIIPLEYQSLLITADSRNQDSNHQWWQSTIHDSDKISQQENSGYYGNHSELHSHCTSPVVNVLWSKHHLCMWGCPAIAFALEEHALCFAATDGPGSLVPLEPFLWVIAAGRWERAWRNFSYDHQWLGCLAFSKFAMMDVGQRCACDKEVPPCEEFISPFLLHLGPLRPLVLDRKHTDM